MFTRNLILKVKSFFIRLPLLFLVLYSSLSYSIDYYVSPEGSDKNLGGINKPFKTVQKAADNVRAGDTVYIREGIYRETVNITKSGKKGAPIRFVAMPGEKVLFDGRTSLIGEWKEYRNGIYVLEEQPKVEQLFYEEEMMIEARWPNATFDELLEREVWAKVDKGSQYGKIVDQELKELKGNFHDAKIILNIGHQYYTWKRPIVNNHGGVITYAKNLKGLEQFLGNMGKKKSKWEDDYYYLVGSLSLLDSKGEWFYNPESSKLYFYPPDDNKFKLKVKVRDYAFIVKNKKHIELDGFDYVATTVSMKKCIACLIKNSNFQFATHTNNPEVASETLVTGNSNKILNSNFSHSSGGVIKVVGNNNEISNVTINNASWYGTLRHPAVLLMGNDNNLNYSNISNAGSVLAMFKKGANVIEYNDIQRGGLLSKDVALIYTGWPETSGSIIRYNWVHDIQVEPGEGICIRGDGFTRGLTIHHNVAWNCGHAGIVIKGEDNKVYNNTVFSVGGKGYKKGIALFVPQGKEAFKPTNKKFKRLAQQNQNSIIMNNAVDSFAKDRKGSSIKKNQRVCGNYIGAITKHFDKNKFIPSPDTPYSIKGCILNKSSYETSFPVYIGAYDNLLPYWVPGRE